MQLWSSRKSYKESGKPIKVPSSPQNFVLGVGTSILDCTNQCKIANCGGTSRVMLMLVLVEV